MSSERLQKTPMQDKTNKLQTVEYIIRLLSSLLSRTEKPIHLRIDSWIIRFMADGIDLDLFTN